MRVKNVGEAKVILRANGIKWKSAKYTTGNEGVIETDDRDADSLLRGYGLVKSH